MNAPRPNAALGGHLKISISSAVKMTAATTPRRAELRQVGGASVFAWVLRPERARALASSRERGQPARRFGSTRPPCVPLCLRRRFFFVWAISGIQRNTRAELLRSGREPALDRLQ